MYWALTQPTTAWTDLTLDIQKYGFYNIYSKQDEIVLQK